MSHKMATVFCFRIWASLLALMAIVKANPEQGKWIFTLNQDKQFAGVAKHMFNNSKVTATVSLTCWGDSRGQVEISWLLRLSPCALEYEQINSNEDKGLLESYMNYPIPLYNPRDPMPYHTVQLMRASLTQPCSETQFMLEGNASQTPFNWKVDNLPKTLLDPQAPRPPPPAATQTSPAPASTNRSATPHPPAVTRHKRAAPPPPPLPAQPRGKPEQPQVSTTKAGNLDLSTVVGIHTNQVQHHPIATTWQDGNYLFILHFRPANFKAQFEATVTIRTYYGDENYISALDYPLLIFYGVMGVVYIVLGVVWLLLLACNWRDLLRVQFWIGGVIFLGMLEKAVFFAEYENLNKTGESGMGTIVFAELVSCLKRTLARMLVIIVSLGFGIVKPRLGQAFHKVLIVGVLFLVFSAIEGYMRASSSKVDPSNHFLLAAVPLAVLDAVICWWIFSSLIQTTRTLRLRRNVVKLSLYRHFTNALVFNVLASVAYMVWFLTQHKFKKCVKDWQQLWVDEAFWHVLFVVLLFIIILLWRPNANNQRYAYSPLLDAADEEEDVTMNDAFEGMKMRGTRNGMPKQRDSKDKMEEDLKWVEDNIPSSVADKALPAMLDSDEELMTTKFEMSKME